MPCYDGAWQRVNLFAAPSSGGFHPMRGSQRSTLAIHPGVGLGAAYWHWHFEIYDLTGSGWSIVRLVKTPAHVSTKQVRKTATQWDLPASSENYRAFLVRLWRDSSQTAWRASLQDAVSGQRHTFSGVEGLIGFLLDQVGETNAPVDGASGKAGKP